jgi:hypothetical protein
MLLSACCQLPGRGLRGDVPQWHVHLASVTLTVPLAGTSGLASPCALQRALTTRGLAACQQPEAPVSAVTVVRAFAATGTLALELGTSGLSLRLGWPPVSYHEATLGRRWARRLPAAARDRREPRAAVSTERPRVPQSACMQTNQPEHSALLHQGGEPRTWTLHPSHFFRVSLNQHASRSFWACY